MHITLIKKIKSDGAPCRKCAEVEQRLTESGLMHRIDRVVIADEREPQGEGIALARKHGVDTAPFFIVQPDEGPAQIYTVYFRFLKEVLRQESSEQEEIAEIMARNPDLDFI